MDLVKIGFLVKADGLKDANTQVDQLLTKVDKIGKGGKQAATEFDNSQKKVASSTKKVTKEVDATTKALEKQKLVGDYLGKGLDKTTANSIASFKQLGASTEQINQQLNQLGKNGALVQQQKQAAALTKEQEKHQEQVKKVLTQYEGFSSKSLGGGILDSIDKQNKGLQDLNKQYIDIEKSQKKQQGQVTGVVSQYEKLSSKSLGGGILDNIDKQNKGLQELNSHYAALEKEQNKELKRQQASVDLHQKAITLEQAKAKYVSQGYGKTDSTRLARLEVSGADVATLNNYKSAIEATTRATQALNPAVEKVTTSHSNFLDKVKGIAIYAALSAAIYGVMTAMTNLAVSSVKMADEYTSIQNRMKLYITDTQELTKVNSQLAVMSMQNNIGLRETSTLFTRLAPAMQKIGANTAAITSVVDAFGKSLRIGGATLMEASSATIQFSQAMASGKLAGDEFRSISEASPRFLKAIADGSGIAADQLKKMSAAGLLTTEVISRALLKEYPKLIEENKKLGITLEQGANSIKTSFQVMFGEFNEGAGITATLGSAMTDMAMGLFETAKSARESGIAFKEWASSIKDEAVVALELLKFAAISYASYMAATFAVVIGKAIASVVSSFVALGVATVAYYQASAMGATRATAAMLTMKAAVQGVGAAMAAVSLASWATLLLTIGGIATAYLMFRDSASEATQKLVEQSKYADITTESYRELNKEQQKNALFDTEDKLIKANKKVEESYQDVISVVKEYQGKQTLRPDIDSVDVSKVLKGLENGTLAFDTAYRTLKEMGVPDSVINSMMEGTEEYGKTATAANTLAEQAKVMGSNLTLSGSAAQNATLPMKGYGDSISNLAENAKIATNEVGKLVKELNIKLSETKLSYSIEGSTGLGQKYSTDIAADAVAKAAAKEAELNKQNIDALAKLNELRQKGINLFNLVTTSNGKVQTDANSQLEKNTEELMKQTALYNKLKTQSPLVKVDPLTQVDPKAVAVAKELEALDKKRAERDAARNKTDKDGDKDLKRLESIREGYDDQIAAVVRLNNFKAEGMPYDVAKIAAEKDYYEAYTNVEKAFELAEARKTLARIDAKGALENETLLLTKLLLLQEKGVGYELARNLAQAAFSDDQEGMLAAAQSMHNEIVAQQYSLADQVKQQTLLNHYLTQGLSIEEATVKASFKRLEIIQKEAGMKGLSDQQKKLKEDTLENQKQLKIKQTEAQVSQSLTNAEKQRVAYVNAQAGGYDNLIQNMAIANKIASDPTLSPSQAKALVEAEELTNYEKELADLKAKTYITTLKESDAVKDIISNYATWDSVQVGAYDRQQKLLGIAKELSDEAEKQRKNPIGDFSSVDFNVFGDFGNPFESALAGLNEFVAKSTESRNILASIEKDIVAAKEQGLSVKDLELERNIVLANQEKDRKKSIDKGITTSLTLTKSLFKEESKGYKVVSGLEKAYQASQVAFQIWKNREKIKETALELWGYAKSAASYIATTATKIAAEGGLNIVKGIGAVLNQGTGDPYTAFARMAAMAAIVAGLGVAIAGNIGGDSGSVTPANDGTGTVFGDSTAQSESIKNSIDLLSENSDLMLPLTSAMLASLRNIESSIGGVTNLILRGELGKGFNVSEGFQQDKLGSLVGNVGSLALGGAGAIGGGIAGAFGAGLLGAGMGSALGIGLGLATGGIGLLLGATLGKALGGLFGTKTTVNASGLFGEDQKLGDILSEGFNLQEYVDIQTKKKTLGITTSNKSSTKYSKADAELSNQFTLIFSGFYDSILSATDALGFDLSKVSAKLSEHVVSLGKINLKGLNGEQIQEKLTAVFGAAADDIARAATNEVTYVTKTVQQPIKALFGRVRVGYREVTQTVAVVTNVFDDFQKVGEGFFETVVRVATGVEQAAYFTDRLNVTAIKYVDIINKQGDVAAEIVRQSVLLVDTTKNIKGGFYDLVNTFDGTAEELTDFIFTLRDLQDQLFMTGKDADYLTSAMILGAGGLDSLASGLDAYFEMLSPAEQAAELTRRLTNEFAIFGKQLPSDVKAFRNLVSSIDISSEAGQKLYGQILALAPEFNDLQDALSSANSDVNALVQSLRDLAEQARAARGETEQPRNLAYTRSQFEQASVLAMQGDIASAEKLLTLGKDLMGLSKTYSVTGSEYARDLALIQRAATVSADIQEQGLGTSISTTLTPSSGTTTTPTVNTNTTSTDAKLDALREDLNAALLAIAKYTQTAATKLENWDDGDRMTVRIEQYGSNDKIPVSTA